MENTSETLSKLFSNFGPLIGGKDLYSALGYRTYSAFYRGKQRDELGVHVFQIQGRKGWFARTEDVAGWVEKQSNCKK